MPVILCMILAFTMIISACKKEEVEDQCTNCIKYVNINTWQIFRRHSNINKNVSYSGGHIELDNERMTYEKYFHGHTNNLGCLSFCGRSNCSSQVSNLFSSLRRWNCDAVNLLCNKSTYNRGNSYYPHIHQSSTDHVISGIRVRSRSL